MSEASYTAILGIKLQTPNRRDDPQKSTWAFIDTLNWSKDMMTADPWTKPDAT
jgi:hypothetical protein